ncbi:unnamed protein product, partial [Laminaria digitata]
QRLLVEAGAFERFGYTDMATTCARSVLQVHSDFATASDIEIASTCIMTAILKGKHVPGGRSAVESERVGGGIGTGLAGRGGVAVTGAERGGGGGGGGGEGVGCVFEAALAVALRQHREFPHPVSNLWAAGVMVVLHEWMVNRGEFSAAEGLGMSLRGCSPLSQGAETFVEAHLQRVRLFRAQSRRVPVVWTEAVEAASALAKLSDTRGLAPQYARLLLELSRVRLGAEPASPVGALPHALRCLAVCESYSLDAIHASAMTHLAEVHLRMGSTRRARILLRACLGQLLANAPVQSQGEAWLAMAKCEITEFSLESIEDHDFGSGSSDIGSGDGGGGSCTGGSGIGGGGISRESGAGGAGEDEKGGVLDRAVGHLDRAIALLKRCHDFGGLRECFYLKVCV